MPCPASSALSSNTPLLVLRLPDKAAGLSRAARLPDGQPTGFAVGAVRARSVPIGRLRAVHRRDAPVGLAGLSPAATSARQAENDSRGSDDRAPPPAYAQADLWADEYRRRASNPRLGGTYAHERAFLARKL